MTGPVPKILVVDDQAGVRKLLTEVFSSEGMAVTTAADGAQGLAAALRERPSLALVDIRMPVLDGVKLLMALKAHYPGLPVVMMTAVGDTEKVAEAARQGALLTVTKPFDVFRLREMVQRILAGGKSWV